MLGREGRVGGMANSLRGRMYDSRVVAGGFDRSFPLGYTFDSSTSFQTFVPLVPTDNPNQTQPQPPIAHACLFYPPLPSCRLLIGRSRMSFMYGRTRSFGCQFQTLCLWVPGTSHHSHPTPPLPRPLNRRSAVGLVH